MTALLLDAGVSMQSVKVGDLRADRGYLTCMQNARFEVPLTENTRKYKLKRGKNQFSFGFESTYYTFCLRLFFVGRNVYR